MGVELFGAWMQAKEILSTANERIQAAASRATLAEAHFIRAKIVEGIREGAPGGQAFTPLAAATLAMRQIAGFKGTKPLIRNADLRNGITITKGLAGDGVFVGILRSAKTKEGKSLINVAEIHEKGRGPIVIPITPKSHRFYFMALRRAGIAPPLGEGSHGVSIAIVKIPARPFLRPVFEKYGQPEDVKKRFFAHVLRELGGDLGAG